jgi:site-specific recombinase XerD
MSTVGQVLFGFFEDHLKVQKGLRPGSIKSYRDTIKLFLAFVSSTCRKPVTRLSLTDLSSQRVLEFLQMIEVQRHNKPQTRNQRLAALHAFYRFVATHHCEMLAEAERVEAIPNKRTSPAPTRYLEHEEIDQLFQTLASLGRRALRDQALLMLLYNTGARVQEVADLHVGDVDLDGPLRVRLHGKGDKWRGCPLWPETVDLLKQLDTVQGGDAKAALFVSSRRQPLTRFGIYKLVRRHTQDLVRSDGSDRRKTISPHVFRHTTAVRLLESGVEANVIRGWLGHVSLDTTNRYAEITMQTKQAALAACMPPTTSVAYPARAGWRQDQDLMKWLQSL